MGVSKAANILGARITGLSIGELWKKLESDVQSVFEDRGIRASTRFDVWMKFHSKMEHAIAPDAVKLPIQHCAYPEAHLLI